MSEVIPILLITICFPIWIVFHYLTKMKTMKGLSSEDEKCSVKSGNPPTGWRNESRHWNVSSTSRRRTGEGGHERVL
jgi:hypothetical protein